MAAHFILATLAASFAPNAAITEHLSEPTQVDVAYEALQAGDTAAAVRQLEESQDSDPARLINLGAAYAGEGRFTDAEAMFRAAIASDERYRLELADGSWLDSRDAARLALARLQQASALALR